MEATLLAKPRRRAHIRAGDRLDAFAKATEDITLSEWSDRYRVLSPEASAEPGPWRTDRAPYLREIQDVLGDPDTEKMVWVAASQVAKTEVLNNFVGRSIDLDPSPMLVVQPSLDMARVWSKDRLAPMLRDCKRLRGKIAEAKSRDSGNTTLHKAYPGGRLAIIGANSPAGLASRPIRVVLFDEVDRYPPSAGTEGDPILLAEQRQRNFWNRLTFYVSSPGELISSRIWPEWLASDQRLFNVACPHCEQDIVLDWKNVTWEKDKTEDGRTIHHTETAVYACQECGAAIEEYDKTDLLMSGVWRATNTRGVEYQDGEDVRVGTGMFPGFHISALYSPWVTWSELAELFVRVTESGDPEKLKTFINLQLGQPWEERDDTLEISDLSRAVEAYPAEVPTGVGVLTAAVDVQEDRLEVAVKGWGDREESWLITHQRIYGDPEQDDVWQTLQYWLHRAYRHESGRNLYIQATMIDSGFLQKQVFKFVRGKEKSPPRIYASKGADSRVKEDLKRAKSKNRQGVKPWTINTYHFKTIVFRRLRLTATRELSEQSELRGPGIMHFCRPSKTGADAEYFAQFGSEIPTKVRQGRMFVRVFKQIRERNEAFDLEVYNLCALYSLGDANIERLAAMADAMAEPPDEPEPNEAPERRTTVKPKRGKQTWAKNWRGR